IPYLPLQDYPQQVRMLSQQRTFHPGEVTDYFRVKTDLIFGYSLYRVLDRIWAPVLAPDQSLRVTFIVCFLAFLLAVWRLAERLEVSPGLATLLACPLALSCPFRLGLAPFMLGFPCALLALSEAIVILEKPSVSPTIRLALFLALAHMAHPVTFM